MSVRIIAEKRIIKESYTDSEKRKIYDQWVNAGNNPEYPPEAYTDYVYDLWNDKLNESKVELPKGFREFTKSDWYGYAGASRFPDGSEPITSDINDDIIIIVSGDNEDENTIVVEVDFFVSDEDQYICSKLFKTKKPAVKFADLIAQELRGWTEFDEDDVHNFAEAYNMNEI